MSLQTCPACLKDGAYVGLNDVECRSYNCKFFTPRQLGDYVAATEKAREKERIAITYKTTEEEGKDNAYYTDLGMPIAYPRSW